MMQVPFGKFPVPLLEDVEVRSPLPRRGWYFEDAWGNRFPVPAGSEQFADGFGPLHAGKPGRPAWTRGLLIGTVQLAFEEHGPMSLLTFCRIAAISQQTIQRAFPGGWHQLLAEAGLEPPPRRNARPNWSDEELLADYHRLCEQLGRPPTESQLCRFGVASSQTYRNRFGRTAELRERYESWLAPRDADRGRPRDMT